MWKVFESLRASLNGAYAQSLRSGRPRGACAAIPLTTLPEPQRAVCGLLLAESRRLLLARRGNSLTGVPALEGVLKREAGDYTLGGRTSTYVPFLAPAIAEPSRPYQCVRVLTELPGRLAEFYSSEEKVLEGGCSDALVLADVDRRYRKVVGPRSEWIAYLHRPDTEPLWDWQRADTIKCRCAVAAVKKKNPKQLRKILAVVPKNTRWGPPLREKQLGLYGGGALTRVMVSGSCLSTGSLDLENAFTYCEWPPWVWSYQAAPPITIDEAPPWARKRYPGLPGSSIIFPCYRRLAMGSTHAVDVLMAIVLLARVVRSSLSASLPGDTATFLLWHGYDATKRVAWEIFSGEGRWSSAFDSRPSWCILRPIDILNDSRCDLLSKFFLRLVLVIIEGRYI